MSAKKNKKEGGFPSPGNTGWMQSFTKNVKKSVMMSSEAMLSGARKVPMPSMPSISNTNADSVAASSQSKGDGYFMKIQTKEDESTIKSAIMSAQIVQAGDYHTSVLSIMSGQRLVGSESDKDHVKVKWLRSLNSKSNEQDIKYTPILNASDRGFYHPSVDDIGCWIRAEIFFISSQHKNMFGRLKFTNDKSSTSTATAHPLVILTTDSPLICDPKVANKASALMQKRNVVFDNLLCSDSIATLTASLRIEIENNEFKVTVGLSKSNEQQILKKSSVSSTSIKRKEKIAFKEVIKGFDNKHQIVTGDENDASTLSTISSSSANAMKVTDERMGLYIDANSTDSFTIWYAVKSESIVKTIRLIASDNVERDIIALTFRGLREEVTGRPDEIDEAELDNLLRVSANADQMSISLADLLPSPEYSKSPNKKHILRSQSNSSTVSGIDLSASDDDSLIDPRKRTLSQQGVMYPEVEEYLNYHYKIPFYATLMPVYPEVWKQLGYTYEELEQLSQLNKSLIYNKHQTLASSNQYGGSPRSASSLIPFGRNIIMSREGSIVSLNTTNESADTATDDGEEPEEMDDDNNNESDDNNEKKSILDEESEVESGDENDNESNEKKEKQTNNKNIFSSIAPDGLNGLRSTTSNVKNLIGVSLASALDPLSVMRTSEKGQKRETKQNETDNSNNHYSKPRSSSNIDPVIISSKKYDVIVNVKEIIGDKKFIENEKHLGLQLKDITRKEGQGTSTLIVVEDISSNLQSNRKTYLREDDDRIRVGDYLVCINNVDVEKIVLDHPNENVLSSISTHLRSLLNANGNEDITLKFSYGSPLLLLQNISRSSSADNMIAQQSSVPITNDTPSEREKELEIELKKMESSFRKMEKAVKKAGVMVETHRTAAKNARTELAIITNERNVLRNSQLSLQTAKDGVDKELSRTNHEFENVKKELEHTKNQYEELQKTMNVTIAGNKEHLVKEMEIEIHTIKQAKDNLGELLDVSRETTKKLLKSLEEKNTEITRLEVELNNLRLKYKKIEQEKTDIQHQISTQNKDMIQQLEDALRSKSDVDELMKKTISEKNSIIDSQANEISKQNINLSKIEEELKHEKQNNESLTSTLKEKANQHEITEKRVKDLENEINMLNTTRARDVELQDALQQATDALQQAEKVQGENDILRTQVNSYKQKCASLAQEVSKIANSEALLNEKNDLIVKLQLEKAKFMEASDELIAYKRAIKEYAEILRNELVNGRSESWNLRPRIFDHLYKQQLNDNQKR